MTNDDRLLRSEERSALQQLAEQPGIDGQRAVALLALDEGKTQVAAAETSGLTTNQVRYIKKKFSEDRLLAFPNALALLPVQVEVEEEEIATAPSESSGQLNRLLVEIDNLMSELREALPDAGESPYSPLRMLALVRDTAAHYTPDVQVKLLEPFEGMVVEDLVDPQTWKGIAYMIAYSAQFQAVQAKDAMNERLPDPVKPDTVYENVRISLDRITPEVARDMAANLEGASREDFLDPDTWKGMAYMLAYSTQFQAGQAKDRLNETLPDPIKPDTIWSMVMGGINRFTPDVVKEIVASFEGATREDLLDPDTWKGVWYMLNYSLQFQAEQLRNRLIGEVQGEDEEE
jgi:hypothetical protein